MRDVLKIAVGIFLGILIITICAAISIALLTGFFAIKGSEESSPSTSLLDQTATPLPLREGDPLKVGNLEITVLSHSVTECVTLSTGEEKCPPDGAAYLWIQLQARHNGDASALPVWASFTTSLLYRGQPQPNAYFFDGTPDKPYWPGYTDGSGNTQMYGGGSLDGWLAFTVPSSFDDTDVVVHLRKWNDDHLAEADWVLYE